MLFVLGVGSSVSVYGAIITIFTDQFPGLKYWKAALVTTVLGFVLGLIYVTPVIILITTYFMIIIPSRKKNTCVKGHHCLHQDSYHEYVTVHFTIYVFYIAGRSVHAQFGRLLRRLIQHLYPRIY